MQAEQCIQSGVDEDSASYWDSDIEVSKRLEPLAPCHSYPPGIEISHQGSPTKNIYLIERGLVKLTRLEEDGREIIIDLRFPRWMIGSASAVIHRPYSVTAMTLTRCELRRIPLEDFLHLVKTDSQFSWYLHQLHSQEVFQHVARVAQLGCLSARQRLEELLWQLICSLELLDSQKEIKLDMPLKNWEVAALIAVAPAYLSRLLNQMEDDNTIHRRNGWLVVPDPQKLWHWQGN
ncbi:MAG TPA: Crp/Fnr family transcriptional regulator [Pyrinomonadaceae bacterium]|jgi:CRP/FNR family transcriptional regulator